MFSVLILIAITISVIIHIESMYETGSVGQVEHIETFCSVLAWELTESDRSVPEGISCHLRFTSKYDIERKVVEGNVNIIFLDSSEQKIFENNFTINDSSKKSEFLPSHFEIEVPSDNIDGTAI